jgi:hypothetical protein
VPSKATWINVTVAGSYFSNSFHGSGSNFYEPGSSCPLTTAPVGGLQSVTVEYNVSFTALPGAIEFWKLDNARLIVDDAPRLFSTCTLDWYASAVFYFDVNSTNSSLTITLTKTNGTYTTFLAYVFYERCDPTLVGNVSRPYNNFDGSFGGRPTANYTIEAPFIGRYYLHVGVDRSSGCAFQVNQTGFDWGMVSVVQSGPAVPQGGGGGGGINTAQCNYPALLLFLILIIASAFLRIKKERKINKENERKREWGSRSTITSPTATVIVKMRVGRRQF